MTVRTLRSRHVLTDGTVIGMSSQRVAVLGLGRMGAAMARRLSGEGWPVLGWHRSGAPVEGVTVEADLGTAVAQAGIVLISLFDDAACAEVLSQARPDILAGTPVVNTTTTSPDAATSFAAALGPSYVHAPVLGSIPAVAGGALLFLVGGEPATITRVTPLLQALGQTIHVGQPHAAAASKLVSNGALARVVATVRAALRHADGMGLDRSVALEVLQHGPVGGLVRAKREQLTDSAAARPAEFTVAALAKDQALLAAASPHPWPLARETEGAIVSGAVGAEDDVAALMTAAAEDEAVLAPLHAYIRGHATGDPAHFRDAFLPSAHIEGLRDGTFASLTLDEFMRLFPGQPAADEPERRRRIDEVVIGGTVASATMTLYHGPTTFTDMFVLVQTDAGWRIANKVYHRH